jgi:hypothetical protein
MRAVERGLRSTLWRRDDGTTLRQYHDTGAWSEPLREDDEPVYAAAAPPPGARPPPRYLRAALRQLAREPRDVDELARLCAVEVATAWSYATRVVELWPLAHDLALPLVHPPLVEALRGLDDHAGSLRDLMARVEAAAPLRGDVAWRCTRDRHAHLRLARVCLQAAGELR